MYEIGKKNEEACIADQKNFRFPIEELNNLGESVTSLFSAISKATETMADNVVCKLDNHNLEKVVKLTQNGNWWEIMENRGENDKQTMFYHFADGEYVDTAVLPVDLSTVMMAAVLHSVEKELTDVEKIGEEIENFLLSEEEIAIEKAVEKLLSILVDFKVNWNDPDFVKESYKTVIEIREKAKNNITAYQQKVVAPLNSNKILTSLEQIKEILTALVKNFKYYRLDLYVFSMASYLEILLSGKYDKEYIESVKAKIEDHSHKYRSIFKRCSEELERHTTKTMRTNIIKEREPDEYIREGVRHLKTSAYEVEKEALQEFSGIKTAGTVMFVHKMEDLVKIFYYTKDICFDRNNIYFLSEQN